MKAVMYGAGSIGRGFIGALFSEIGYEVVFIDVNDDVIHLINKEKTYPQIIMNEEQPVHWIKNIRAVDGKDSEAVSNEIADADIIATALGAAVLEKVAPVIAQGLLKRWEKESSNTLDILICENLMDADVLLRDYLLKALPEDKHALFEKNVGLVETSIGRMVPPADPDLIPEDEPNKGEYYLMDKSQGNLVNHVIFQCPNEKGKGVLVAPTVHGNLIVGPDSQPSAANDVSTTKQGLDFVRNTALKSVPGINFRESIRNFAGVRARTADHDFHIYEDKNNKGFINIAGMQSPGLSSACAIAPDILKMLENSGLTLEAKEDIVDERHIDRFKHLSHEDRAKLVEKNPAFGKIICRCETITEGEIINAVHRPIPATSIDAVKRRCNAGMGRCQGGFCGPRVQEIIARELNKPLADIPQDRLGTNIITGETKDGGAK